VNSYQTPTNSMVTGRLVIMSDNEARILLTCHLHEILFSELLRLVIAFIARSLIYIEGKIELGVVGVWAKNTHLKSPVNNFSKELRGAVYLIEHASYDSSRVRLTMPGISKNNLSDNSDVAPLTSSGKSKDAYLVPFAV